MAIASSTVTMSLTASTRAFSHWIGVRVLGMIREEVLRVSTVGRGGGEGGREGEARAGACEVPRVPILGVFY